MIRCGIRSLGLSKCTLDMILFISVLVLSSLVLLSYPTNASSQELSHDDGSPEFGFRAGAQVMGAVLFDAAAGTHLKKLRFYVWGEAESVSVYVLNSVQQVIHSENVHFDGSAGWYEIDVSDEGILLNGESYVGWMWVSEHSCPPCSWLGVDKDGPPHYRSYLGTIGNLQLVRDVPEDHGVRQENYMIRVIVDTEEEPHNGEHPTILIVVNENVRYGIDGDLGVFEQDLEAEGYEVQVKVINDQSSPPEIRAFIQSYYESDNLVGAVLVGDIPAAYFEWRGVWPSDNLVSKEIWLGFQPTDMYYMDLDGEWEHVNTPDLCEDRPDEFWGFSIIGCEPDETCDTFKDEYIVYFDESKEWDYDQIVDKDQYKAEIWVSRIMAHNLRIPGKSEVEILNDYFKANHAYRTGEGTVADKAYMLYYGSLPTDPYNEQGMDWSGIFTKIVKHDNVTKADFTACLEDLEGSKLLYLTAHSAPQSHQWADGGMSVSELMTTEKNSIFYLVNGCQACRWDQYISTPDSPNYLGGIYVFDKTRPGTGCGLGAVGCTGVGGLYQLAYFSAYLTANPDAPYGEAFRHWFNNDLSPSFRILNYVFLGDGTITPRLQYENQQACIEGWVWDEETQQPIQGARVEIITGPSSGSDTTDSSGHYRICNLKEGDYQLKASKSGWKNSYAPGDDVTGEPGCTQCKKVSFYLQRGEPVPVSGDILFDQRDQHHYGDQLFPDIDSTGTIGYSTFRTALENAGYEINKLNSGLITNAILANYKILVIMPTLHNYSSSEITAIKNYVSGGGSLLILGDWAKYAPYINAVAEAFDTKFNGYRVANSTSNLNGDSFQPRIRNFGCSSPPCNHSLTHITDGIASYYMVNGTFIEAGSPDKALAWFDWRESPNQPREHTWIDQNENGYEDSGEEYRPGHGSCTVLSWLKYENGRVVFSADASFLYNSVIDEADDLQLGLNIICWLAETTSEPGPPPPSDQETHTFPAGWSLVSVPLNSGTSVELFGTTAYRWNPGTGQYDMPTTIEPPKGYWVNLSASKTVTDTGYKVTTDVIIDISSKGWYQISAPWSYPKSAIQVIKGAETKSWADAAAAGWVRNDIYGYVAPDGAYTTPSTLNPWYGYWVKTEVSGLSLKLLYASGTPLSLAYAPMAAPLAFAPADLPPMPPTAVPPSAATLTFGNSPNPVVDVYTTYFEVKGAAAYLVDVIKVQIFDLSGRLVYEAEEASASMAWHTENSDGEYLANGVYLYKLYALLDGQWVVSGVQNVVILR